jgi:hypothetical protein
VTPASPTPCRWQHAAVYGNRNLQRQHHKEPEQLCYLGFISDRSCNRQQRLRHTRPSACDRRRFNRNRRNLRDCKWDSYADSYAVKRVICNLRRPLSILRHWTGAGQCSRGDRCPTAFTVLQATGIRGCMTTTDPPSETSPLNLLILGGMPKPPMSYRIHTNYRNFPYSSFACFRRGMSESASCQSAKNFS